MHPREIHIRDYTYNLPPGRIAHYPSEKRDEAKLLVYRDGLIQEDIFRNLSAHIPGKSLLLFNNTRVSEARIHFRKTTGAEIEIFCLEPGDEYQDMHSAMTRAGKVSWKCLIGGASKWKRGQVLQKKTPVPGGEILLEATYVDKKGDQFLIDLQWQPREMSFAEILHFVGEVPLPPYIKRKPGLSDKERYQTVYSKEEGSVAAPTAGLHFTSNLFETLKQHDVQFEFLTLHVGAGTFKPVKTGTIGGHEMHAEYIEVTADTLRCLLDNRDGCIIAVGTTSLRTMESLYWIGVRCMMNAWHHGSEISQWEPYEHAGQSIEVTVALRALLDWMESQRLDRLLTKTRIMIAPGYKIKIAKALITNFHLPDSTLLLLVAAFIGDRWRTVYEYALTHDFRFLSYGDGSLLWLDEQEVRKRFSSGEAER